VSDRAQELFERFVDAHEAGKEPDPAAAISEAGPDGDALSAMLVAYLATHPHQPSADEVLAMAARPELEAARPWPELLPALRERSRTTRGALIRQLAEKLAVRDSESQVEGYVHELETGQLSPRRVRPAVVDALAAILAVPRAVLEAGRSLPEPPALSAPGAVFARQAEASSADALSMLADQAPPDPRVADLFLGGPDG
jgi:hypothetical protein